MKINLTNTEWGRSLREALEGLYLTNEERFVPLRIEYNNTTGEYRIGSVTRLPDGPWEEETSILMRLKDMDPITGNTWEYYLHDAMKKGSSEVRIPVSQWNDYIKAVEYKKPSEFRGWSQK